MDERSKIENLILEIEKERKQHNLIINSLPSLIFLKDTKNNIIFSNDTAATAAGYSSEEMKNKPSSDFFPLANEYYKADTEVIESKLPKLGIVEEYITEKNEPIYIKTDKIPIFDSSGNVESLLVIASDITETKNLENKLRAEVETKNKILNSTKLSIISTDKNGYIELFSKGAELMLGFKSEEVVNKIKLDFLHDREEIESRAKSLSKECNISVSPDFSVFAEKAIRGLNSDKEWTYVKKDGSKIPVLLSISAIQDQNNEITGYLAIAKDISIEKRVQFEQKIREDLEQKINQAELTAIRRSRFLANISHEIRTPLTTIISLSELLSEEKLDDSITQDIGDILNSAYHLNKMIGGILDFSKIESGQLALIPAKIDLKSFIRGLRRNLQTFAESKNIKYEVEILGKVPEFIEIDATRTRQVVDNLTSNACKFTPEGGEVKLIISINQDSINFSIVDTGPGIPFSIQEKIFEPYYQADVSLARKESGIGLGLAICKELATIMGGTLEISSVLGQGSNFSFSIPYLEINKSYDNKIDTCSLFLEKKVLIADDNLINRKATVRLLKSMGIETIEANDGKEVIEVIKNKNIDLVLLDVHMPKMDGIEVLNILNMDKTIPRPPIAMLTACVTKEEQQTAFKLGAEGYIVKPFGRNVLEKELENLLMLQSVDQKTS